MASILSIEPDGRLLPGASGLSAQQAEALRLDRHVTVVAGAGSGKTRTLTRRYVRILGAQAWEAAVAGQERAAGPESVLVCTFTERAAGEMATRIRAELGQAVRELRDRRAELSPEVGADRIDAVLDHLATAKERFDRARIGTFHGFASACLREFAAQVGLDPGFAVLESAEQTLLVEGVAEQTLAAAEARGEPALLFDVFDRRGLLDVLRTWVNRRHDLRPFGAYVTGSDEELLARWQQHYAAVELDELENAVSRAGPLWPLLEAFADLEHDLTDPTAPPKAIAHAKRALALMDAPPPSHPVDRADRLRALCRVFRTDDGRGHIAKGHHTWTGKGELIRYPERRREIEQSWNELRPSLVSMFGEHGERLETLLGTADRAGAPALRALAELGGHAVSRYQQALADARSLDFAELEARLLTLLEQSEFARARLQRRFRHILVDEFQDTNTTQWRVVRLLLGTPMRGSGLFLVGDPKQAIYRFRGGDVTVFARARAELARVGGLQLAFSANYRSRPALIRSFNALFGWLMPSVDAAADPWEARFEPLEARRHLDPGDSDPGRLDLIWHEARDAAEEEQDALHSGGSDEAEDEPPPADTTDHAAQDAAERTDVAAAELPPELSNLPPAHREAQMVARLIADVLLPGSDSHDGLRVAVLLRRRTHLAIYARALREARVPHVVARGRGFFARQEVQDLGNLLLALAHRDDAIALLGALRGPFLRLEDAWLLWLARAGRLSGRRDPLVLGWRRVLDLAAGRLDREEEDALAWSELPDAGQDALIAAAERFARWQALSRAMPLSTFLRRIVTEAAAVYGFAKADPTGQAMANIEKLISLALSYDSRGAEGHADFADFLLAQDTLGADEGEAALDATAPVVVMTIHQSKGLEFPCVVLPDLLQPLRMSGHRPLLMARLPSSITASPDTPDLWEPGIAVPVVQAGQREAHDMLLRRLIRRQDRWEDVAEARRLLYVALTRARDRVVTLSLPLGDEAVRRIGAQDRDAARTWSEWLRMWTVADRVVEDLDVHLHRPDPDRDRFPTPELLGDAAARRARLGVQGWHPDADDLDPAAVLGDLPTLSRRLAAVALPPVRRTSPHALQGPAPPAASWTGSAPPPPAPLDRRAAGILRGLLVHGCLEDGVTRPSPLTRRRVRHALAAHGLVDDAAEAWLHDTLVRHLRGYRKAAPTELDDPTAVFRELPFRLPLPQIDGQGPAWLDGVIDVVYRLEGEPVWSVLDYKSDEGDPDQLAVAYAPQLLAYAWAASRVLPDLRDRGHTITAELLFTASGRRLRLFEPASAEEIAERFAEHLRSAGPHC